MAVAGHHARLGTRLRAKLCRGHYFKRLNPISFQGTTRPEPDGRIRFLSRMTSGETGIGKGMEHLRLRKPALGQCKHSCPGDSTQRTALGPMYMQFSHFSTRVSADPTGEISPLRSLCVSVTQIGRLITQNPFLGLAGANERYRLITTVSLRFARQPTTMRNLDLGRASETRSG